MIVKSLRVILVLGLALSVGCGDDDDHGEETAFEDACGHLEDSGVAISASATADIDAPVFGEDAHTRYDLTLPASDAGYEGSVTFASDEVAEYAVVANNSSSLSIISSDGTTVSIEESVAEACHDIEGSTASIFDLDVGTYILTFSSSDSSTVNVLIGEYGEEHDH